MSSFISLEEAVTMTTAYRQNRESILKPEYQGKNILCKSETFEKSQVETILNQEGCVSLRVYYGMDDSMKVHAILVGVNKNNEDILGAGAASISMTTDTNSFLENGQRCPEECPPSSPLNP